MSTYKLENVKHDIWLYDTVVFKNHWQVTFHNIKTLQRYTFINDYEGVKNFYNQSSGYLTGFNNRYYGDYILKAILKNINPYDISNFMLVAKQSGHLHSDAKFVKLKFYSFDIMEILSNERISLRKYKAFLGLKISKLSMPFNYELNLRDEQKQEINNYINENLDVLVLLFNKFIDEFLGKAYVIQISQLDNNVIKETPAKISALLTQAKPLKKYTEFNFQVHSKIKNIYETMFPEYLWVIKRFEEPLYYTQESKNYRPDQINFQVGLPDYQIDCKGGGAHGSVKGKFEENEDNIILHIDYKSNYSYIMANFNLGSRASQNINQVLKILLEQRKEAQRLGENTLANYIKKILVSTFGAMDDKHNKLYDPQQRLSVCITGQLLILPLHLLLEKYAIFLQVNTDGIIIKVKKNDITNNYKNILLTINNWKRITNMPIDISVYNKLYQKDENNYLLLNSTLGVETWRAKGKFLKSFNNQFHKPTYKQAGLHSNSLTIIDEAIVNYLAYKTPLIETIKNCQDLARFQQIIDLKGKYQYFLYGDEIVENADVIRVFYTKTGSAIKKAYSVNNLMQSEKVAYTSERSTLFNDDISKYSINDFVLDYEYYERIAKDFLIKFSAKPTELNLKNPYPGNCNECKICGDSLLTEKKVRYFYGKEVCRSCYINKNTELIEKNIKEETLQH